MKITEQEIFDIAHGVLDEKYPQDGFPRVSIAAEIAFMLFKYMEETEDWIPIEEELPQMHRHVALINKERRENCAPEIYVARCGFLNQIGAVTFWSCYGERAMDINSFTHWKELPPHKEIQNEN